MISIFNTADKKIHATYEENGKSYKLSSKFIQLIVASASHYEYADAHGHFNNYKQSQRQFLSALHVFAKNNNMTREAALSPMLNATSVIDETDVGDKIKTGKYKRIASSDMHEIVTYSSSTTFTENVRHLVLLSVKNGRHLKSKKLNKLRKQLKELNL